MKSFRLSFMLGLIAAFLLIAGIKPMTAHAAYNVSFANFWIGKVTPGSGHIGVDIWWNNGSGDYLPCQNSHDAFYDACALSNAAQSSYYKVMNYTPTTSDFPYGVFIDNQDPDVCTSSSWCGDPGGGDTINHGWARIINSGSLEIYPHIAGSYNPSANTVGGVRLVDGFFNFANGGRYSDNIGDIALPQIGEANVGKLNGFVTSGGSSVANNRVLFEAFQEQSTRSSSTGYPLTGFTTVRNNSDGYYSTGAVPSGTYKIYITDTQSGHKIILNDIGVNSQYERLDFRIDQNCFGYPGPNCQDPAP